MADAHTTRAKVHRFTLAGALLSVAAGAFIGLGGYTFHEAKGTAYLSDDPAACVNCHVMNEHFDSWSKSAHHAVATCNDCHVPHDTVGKYMAKMDHGWRHSKAFTLQDFHEPIQITPADLKIVEINCVRCHEAFVGDAVGAAVHGGGTETGISCVHCHSRAAHGPTR